MGDFSDLGGNVDFARVMGNTPLVQRNDKIFPEIVKIRRSVSAKVHSG